jgi:hypothetical protein
MPCIDEGTWEEHELICRCMRAYRVRKISDSTSATPINLIVAAPRSSVEAYSCWTIHDIDVRVTPRVEAFVPPALTAIRIVRGGERLPSVRLSTEEGAVTTAPFQLVTGEP